MLYLVEDTAHLPAQYGALAALLADSLDAILMYPATRFDEQRYPDAVQHVTADGRLVASGLVWRQRTGRPDAAGFSDAAEFVAAAQTRDVVVPVHPCHADDDAFSAAALREFAAHQGVAVRVLQVVREAGSASIVESDGAARRVVLDAVQDRYGRLECTHAHTHARHERPQITRDLTRLKIALIGRECEQREQYPATLAALGDAADALQFDLDVHFIAAQDIDDARAAELLGSADGIVLPGGSDMSRVAGQVAAARFGWLAARPLVGLCLGMQSMATAIARLALGTNEIGMMEAQPDARIASFVPVGVNDDGSLAHRLGAQPVVTVRDSRIASLLGAHASVRCNHRYRLNPALEEPLAMMGVTVSARDESGLIADAIESRTHPFFVGMQGHPELSSRRDSPHPLLVAFLEATAQARGIAR